MGGHATEFLKNLVVLIRVARDYLAVQRIAHLDLAWQRRLQLEERKRRVVRGDVHAIFLVLELLQKKLNEAVEDNCRVLLIGEALGVHEGNHDNNQGVGTDATCIGPVRTFIDVVEVAPLQQIFEDDRNGVQRRVGGHPILHVVGGHDAQMIDASAILRRVERFDGEIDLNRHLALFFFVLGVEVGILGRFFEGNVRVDFLGYAFTYKFENGNSGSCDELDVRDPTSTLDHLQNGA